MTPKELYSIIFSNKSYAVHERTMPRYQYVLDRLEGLGIKSILDIGAGRGLMAKMLLEKGYDVHTADLEKFHTLDVPHYDIDLEKDVEIPRTYDLVVCLDVLEHVDEKYVGKAISTIASLGKFAIITAANHSSIHDGFELHKTKREKSWWDNEIKKSFVVLSETINKENTLFMYHLKSINNTLINQI